MKNCEVINCFIGFANVYTNKDTATIEISSNLIFEKDIAEYNLSQFNDCNNKVLFNTFNEYVKNSNTTIFNNLVVESLLF